MGTGANFKNRQYIFYPMLKRQAAGLRCRCSEEKKSCLRYLRRSFSPGTYSWGPCTSRLPGVHAASSRDNFSSANTCSGGKHTPPASGTTALCRAVPCHVLPKAAAGPPAPAPGAALAAARAIVCGCRRGAGSSRSNSCHIICTGCKQPSLSPRHRVKSRLTILS